MSIRYATSVRRSRVRHRPAAILVAAPLDAVPFGPRQLLRAMLVIAPAHARGHHRPRLLCWRDASLRPLGRMVDELEAITDGRSLHRRLAVPRVGATSWPAWPTP